MRLALLLWCFGRTTHALTGEFDDDVPEYASAVPLIVLKNPRSGSSWLVALLNAMPTAFLTEEILTSKSAGHGDIVEEGTAYLVRALKEPMGRFGRGAAFDEETGDARDRAARALGKRATTTWDVLGFTVSPKRILGLNLFAKPSGVFWRVPFAFRRLGRLFSAVSYKGRLYI